MKIAAFALLSAFVATPALAQHEGHGAPPEAEAAPPGALAALHDVRAAPHRRLAAGGLWAFNFVPDGLEPSYGGDSNGAMLFLRATID